MKRQLYDYQIDLENSTREAFKKGFSRVIVALPTGGGKTVCFSNITYNSLKNNCKVLICTDRSEIAKGSDGSGGTVGTLFGFGIDAPVVQQVKYPPINANCCVAMAQTLQRRLGHSNLWDDWFNAFGIIIIDECHESIFDFIFEFLKPHQKVIGYTATPYRSGKMRQLGTLYQTIIAGISTIDLIALGRLAQPIYSEIKTDIDFSSLKATNTTHGWDYKDKDVFQLFDQRVLYSGIVDNWLALASDRHTMVYAQTVMHAARLAKEFNDKGVAAKFIDGGKSKPKDSDGTEKGDAKHYVDLKNWNEYSDLYDKYSGNRAKIFKDFEDKKFPVLINVAIATKGYDCRWINCIVLAFKTASLTKFCQCTGRGGRAYDGKDDFLVMDYGQNVETFGKWEADRTYSLWHDSKNGGGVVPMKLCGGIEYDTRTWSMEKRKQWKIKQDERGTWPCGCNIPVSAMICPICGYIIDRPKKEVVIEMAVPTEPVVIKKVSEMDISEIIAFGKERKRHPNWAFRYIFSKHGRKGLEEAIKIAGYDRSYINHLTFA